MKRVLFLFGLLCFGVSSIVATDTLLSIAGTNFMSYEYGNESGQTRSDCMDLCDDSMDMDCFMGCSSNSYTIILNKDEVDAFNAGQVTKLQNLLDAGADPNVVDSHNATPLRYVVADRDSIEMATALLEAGADKTINIIDTYVGYGKTPLSYAKTQEMKDLLTSYGAI